MVQRLRLCTPNAGGLGSIPDQGARSHMLQLRPSAAKLIKKYKAGLLFQHRLSGGMSGTGRR